MLYQVEKAKETHGATFHGEQFTRTHPTIVQALQAVYTSSPAPIAHTYLYEFILPDNLIPYSMMIIVIILLRSKEHVEIEFSFPANVRCDSQTCTRHLCTTTCAHRFPSPHFFLKHTSSLITPTTNQLNVSRRWTLNFEAFGVLITHVLRISSRNIFCSVDMDLLNKRGLLSEGLGLSNIKAYGIVEKCPWKYNQVRYERSAAHDILL